MAVPVTLYDDPFARLMLLKVAPASVLNCHWYPVMAPEATTLKVTSLPEQTGWLAGCVVMDGPAPA